MDILSHLPPGRKKATEVYIQNPNGIILPVKSPMNMTTPCQYRASKIRREYASPPYRKSHREDTEGRIVRGICGDDLLPMYA